MILWPTSPLQWNTTTRYECKRYLYSWSKSENLIVKCEEKTHPKVDEAVVVLRRSLAEAEEKSITIVTVGFLTNIRSSLYFVHNMSLCGSHAWSNRIRSVDKPVDRDLLLSPGDEISPMPGLDLVKEKVSEALLHLLRKKSQLRNRRNKAKQMNSHPGEPSGNHGWRLPQ